MELIICKWMGIENCCLLLDISFSNKLFFNGNKYPESFPVVFVASVCVHCCVFAPGSHMNTNTSVKGQ